jgi:hypothetical protein
MVPDTTYETPLGLLEVLQLKPTHAEIKPMNLIYKTLGTLRLSLGDLLET